jgi:hypothetical protein
MGRCQRLDHHDPFVSGHRMAQIRQGRFLTTGRTRLIDGRLRGARGADFAVSCPLVSKLRGSSSSNAGLRKGRAGAMLQCRT